MKIKFPLHENKVFFKGNGKVVQGYIAFPNNSIYFATPFVSSGAGLQGAKFSGASGANGPSLISYMTEPDSRTNSPCQYLCLGDFPFVVKEEYSNATAQQEEYFIFFRVQMAVWAEVGSRFQGIEQTVDGIV